MLLTRLELFIRRENLRPVEFGRDAGYTRMHFYRLRVGEADATRAVILAVTGVARKETGKRIAPGELFERADSLLRGSGQRLSMMHRADRKVIDALLDEGDATQLPTRLSESGIASETAVVHLLHRGDTLVKTNPDAAANVYGAAAEMAAALSDSPRELAHSLEANACRAQANALRLLQRFDEALYCLARASEQYANAIYCSDEAGQVDYMRAAIFVELERWDEALAATRSALARFNQTGSTRRAAKAEVLEAIVLFEKGNMDAAHAKWMHLTEILASLRQRDDLARVWLNLGNCEIRRNRPTQARRWLSQAKAAFRKLNNAAELARTNWNIGTYFATFFPKEAKRALRIWTSAYRGFLGLRVWLDAGCVGLDMLETMLDMGEASDDELTLHASGVADALARANLGEGIAPALDQLRRIARSNDRRRVVRMVRTALTDSKANCNEIAAASAALGEAG